jgi:hypothetical protein
VAISAQEQLNRLLEDDTVDDGYVSVPDSQRNSRKADED